MRAVPTSSQRPRVLGLIALVTLPLVALSVLTLWQDYRDERAQIAADRVRLAQAAALALDAFIEGHLSTLRSVAAYPGLARPRDNRALLRFLQGVRRANPDWEGAGIVGPDGYSIATTQGVPSVYVGDRDYFTEAVKTGRPVVSSAIIGRISHKPTVVLSVPFEIASGGRGIVTAPLPTQNFGVGLLKQIGSASLSVVVVDAKGRTFIHPDPARVRALEPLDGRPDAEAVLHGETGSRVLPMLDGAPTLVAYAPVPRHGWGVILAEPTAAAFAPVYRLMRERAGLLAIALATVVALGWFLGGRLSELYRRLSDAREALQRDVETRDGFLAAASHDLRNPLGAISASAEILERSAERPGGVPPERLRACLGHIRLATRRMATLIDGFLDVARVELGRPLELALEDADLVPLVRQVVAECQQTATHLTIACETPERLVARVDVSRLQRVVANVLGNAVKYSPGGGAVRVALTRDGPAAALSVRDSGIGIPEQELGRVFERFYRASNVAGRIAGTGIGLAGVRQIVHEHGGTIAIESALGAGTHITIRVPLGAEAMEKTA
jgi:signal transduction histidine kinase